MILHGCDVCIWAGKDDVFTELEAIAAVWLPVAVLQTCNPKNPLTQNAINKIIVLSSQTNNLPGIYLKPLVDYQFVSRLTPPANGFGGRPESDFLLTLSNGLSPYTLWMQTNQTQIIPPSLLGPFSIHWFLSLLFHLTISLLPLHISLYARWWIC